LDAGFGQPEVLHLALANQVFHRPGHVFDGHIGIDPVLVEQVNGLDLEPFEGGFDDLPDVLGLAVEAALLTGVAVETELRRNYDFVTERGEGLADKFLVDKGAVDFSGVEERDALFDGRADDGDHLLFIPGGAIAKAHAHAAQAEGGDFQLTFS
jgi:hypothetical protein